MKNIMKRQLIDQLITADVVLTGPIKDVINYLEGFLKNYGESAYIKDIYYGYDGGRDTNIYYSREETDDEYQKRLSGENEIKQKKLKERQAKKEREVAQYLKLKAKYETPKTSVQTD
jgi:hypothetical protein